MDKNEALVRECYPTVNPVTRPADQGKPATKGNWIKGAIKHPGAFTAKAKSAGKGVQQYATSVLAKGSKASTTTKKQASLAKTLSKFHK